MVEPNLDFNQENTILAKNESLMNYLDLLIALPICFGIYKGWKRGIIFEIAMMIGLVLGLYVAIKFSGLFEGVVKKMTDSPDKVLPWITFILVFILVLVVMILLARFLEGILKIGKLSQINQLVGAIFGGLKLALAVSVILAIFRPIDSRVKLVDDKIKSESLLYQPVLNLSHFLFPALEDVKQEFEKVIPEPKEK